MNDDSLFGKNEDDILKVSEKELKRAFVSARLKKLCECQTRTIYYDLKNRILECAECGAILDPFDVVVSIADGESRYINNIKFLKQEKEELEKWMLNNRMGATLRKIASNLRQGSIPVCPHCKEPFELDQITEWISKEYAICLSQLKMLNGPRCSCELKGQNQA